MSEGCQVPASGPHRGPRWAQSSPRGLVMLLCEASAEPLLILGQIGTRGHRFENIYGGSMSHAVVGASVRAAPPT